MSKIPDYLREFAQETGAIITIIPQEKPGVNSYVLLWVLIPTIMLCCVGFVVYLHFFG